MKPLDHRVLIAALHWRSVDATHVDRRCFAAVGCARDAVPGGLGIALGEVAAGVPCRESFPAGQLVPPFDPAKVLAIGRAQFKTTQRFRLPIEPQAGRFYPLRLLAAQSPVLPRDRRPFRLLAMDEQGMTIDANHPLAVFALEVEAKVERPLSPASERASCPDVAAQLCADGPGMQARLPERETDFFSNEPFSREDAGDDVRFYAKPRLVQHIDDRARQTIQELYARFVRPGMRVLDLMASWVSHLPEDIDQVDVTGLGLNQEELDQNPHLHTRIVHDLNAQPHIPLPGKAFDAAICTVSVEYLVEPVEVFKEVARLLKPGGTFVVTFSDRWFPTKVIRIWTELHPFERMALVLSYFRRSERFCDLHTESWRGWPRPRDDKYAAQLDASDPVFAVWGRRTDDG